MPGSAGDAPLRKDHRRTRPCGAEPEIREKTAHALIKKNTTDSLRLVVGHSGKGINDMSARVAMSSINEILSLNDKTEVLKVLEDTMGNEELKQEIKDTARSVKALITYSM